MPRLTIRHLHSIRTAFMTTSEDRDKIFIGIDLGGTTLKAALVKSAGEVIDDVRVETEQHDADKLLAQIVAVAKDLKEKAGDRVASIGIGVPGLVNVKTNRIEVMPNLPELSEIDIP